MDRLIFALPTVNLVYSSQVALAEEEEEEEERV